MLVSRHLEKLNHSIKGRTSLGDIVESMRHSGFGLVMVFLCLPFLQPIPMAGLSTALGFVIIVLSVQMILQRPSLWIPRKLAEKEISEKTGRALVDAAAKFFKFVETFVKPRLNFIARRERLIGIAILISAALLALPIPIPLSNMICAVPIVLMALALLEGDGLLALLGFLGVTFAAAFHLALLLLGLEGLRLLWEKTLHWFT